MTARRKFAHSKGDNALHEAWQTAKSALRRSIKKSRFQCWKNLIHEVDKDPWGLPSRVVTKRLATRKRTPSLDNPDRARHIVQSLSPQVEAFLREDRCSCTVQGGKLLKLEELKRAGGRLKANSAPGIYGVPNEILKEVVIVYPEMLLEAFNSRL